jgi:hypothetical protein
MATLGGVQFSIKTITRGMEGSGDYTPDLGEAMTKAMNAIMYYHRDTPFKAKLAEMRKANGREVEEDTLEFYAITEASTQTN